jgi:hypothetical protein
MYKSEHYECFKKQILLIYTVIFLDKYNKRQTARYIQQTARYIQQTSRYIQQTARYIQQTARHTQKTALYVQQGHFDSF